MNWRDTQVQIQGPAALGFQFILARTGTGPQEKSPTYFGKSPQALVKARSCALPQAPPTTPKAPAYISLILFTARKTLLAGQPYFVPDHNLYSALQLAGLRGVDVRILVPGLSDNRLVQHAMHSYIASLSQCQIQFLLTRKVFAPKGIFN